MICPKCKKEAVLVTGEYIYPSNKQYKDNNYYICETCGDYVGCHKGTTKAFGTLADYELREKRIQVHGAFDFMWDSPITRKEAYIYLAKELEIPLAKCHIGLFDLGLCQRALKVMGCG